MTDFAKSSSGDQARDRTPDSAALRGGALQPAVLEAAADALGAAFLIFDQNDKIIFASRNVRQFFPVAPLFLEAGTRLRDLFGALYDAGMRVSSEAPASASKGASREEWIASHTSSHWRERSDKQERDASGRWLRYSRRRLSSGYGLSLVTDITEQKKREEQWRADMERVQLTEEILDNLPNPVVVQDANLTVVAVNLAFSNLLSLSSDGLLGKSMDRVFRSDVAERVNAACRHTLQTGAPSVIAQEIAAEDDPSAPVLIRTKRVGKPGRYFIVTTIDDLAELHDLLPAAAASVSNGMPRPSPASDRREHAAGPAGPFPVTDRNILLVTDDPTIEAQALRTLIALGADCCAVRSIEEEEAFLRLARSSGALVDLVLIDAQMDIACLELAEMQGLDVLPLDAFQLTSDLPQTIGNYLATRANAQRHLPDWQFLTGSEKRTEVEDIDRPLVLVAEDDEVNQIVFAQILESLGYPYKIAVSGDEAVRLCRDLQPGIVMMDVTLPVLSGLEACRIIRELGGPAGADIPIIGVIVDKSGDLRARCLASGMNDTIAKPLSTEMIRDVFERFLKKSVSRLG